MPTYDYICTDCGHQEEVMQKMSDPLLVCCHQCQKSTFKRKLGGGIGLQFQGNGFYITDYASPPAAQSSSTCCPCNKKECTK